MTSEQDDVNFSVPETDGIDDSQVMSRVPRELSTIAEVSDTELSVSSPTTNIEKPINIYLNEKESDKEDSTEEDITLELPEFDWSDFENRFTEALQLLDTEESHILDQFDQLMEMFFIWAQTGSSCETERAVKR
ncbi:hypothetical protein HI914_00089 [Erysiphe necator]|nr:hypothetical protein HI914_00089 [Erysiphe necator]